jgi:capsular polysaccharide biosynthesis protein
VIVTALALEVVISVQRGSDGQPARKPASETGRRGDRHGGSQAASRETDVDSNGDATRHDEVDGDLHEVDVNWTDGIGSRTGEEERDPESTEASDTSMVQLEHEAPIAATDTDAGPADGAGDAWDLTPQTYESPWRSLQHHWKLAALIVALTALAGFAVAVAKTPTSTAETRLIVGKTVNLNNLSATPGLSVAGAELAVTYSRLLDTPAVMADAAKRAGAAGSGGSVAASPIPQSPIIRVEGTGASASTAVAQANAGAKALIKAVGDVNAAQQSFVDHLLKQYQETGAQLIQDQQDLDTAMAQRAANPTNTQLQQEVVKAQTQFDRDTLVHNNLATQYNETASPEQVNAQIIQQLGPAEDTGNDRKSFLAMALLVAVVVGGLLALGVAVLIDKRGRRKSGDASRPALPAAPDE